MVMFIFPLEINSFLKILVSGKIQNCWSLETRNAKLETRASEDLNELSFKTRESTF